jgi:hypothetical protein
MEPPKRTGLCRVRLLIARKFLEAMEERVNNDNIGIQTINSGRKNEVEVNSVDPAISCAADGIQEKPGEELQKMGTGNGGNFVPDDDAGVLRVCDAWWNQGETFNALGIEMNLAMFLARETFQQFGEGTFRAMAAIDKR